MSLGFALTHYILNKDHMCNEVLNVCESPHITEINLESAVNNLLATKPKSLEKDDFVDNLYKEIAADSSGERETLRAVHIADVHLDIDYLPGAKAKCGGELCCRAEYGMAGPGDIAAGEWGSSDGVCDLPKKTFVNMMEYVANEIKPDLIFWTGDNSSHNIWSNTMDEVINYTTQVTNTIKDAIKDKNITVLPMHGNHDSWPVDQEDFFRPNENEAINKYKELWSDWLDEQAIA